MLMLVYLPQKLEFKLIKNKNNKQLYEKRMVEVTKYFLILSSKIFRQKTQTVDNCLFFSLNN